MKVKSSNTSSNFIFCESAAFRYKNRATVDNFVIMFPYEACYSCLKFYFSGYMLFHRYAYLHAWVIKSVLKKFTKEKLVSKNVRNFS